jgi:Ca2+:H+ antiporter
VAAVRATLGWTTYLLPFIPLAIALDVAGASPALIFTSSAAGVIPTASLMGRATEELAERSGPAIGGLLNVTFGNAPELIIALFALGRGLHEVVKASLIGSILGNILLVLGAAMLAGGIKHGRQRFDSGEARGHSSLLLLAAAGIVVPALYVLADGGSLPSPGGERIHYVGLVDGISMGIAVLLIAAYVAGLVRSLREHRAGFIPPDPDVEHAPWTVRRSVAMLAIAGVAVAGMSEILVGSISEAAHSIGLSEFFIGAIVVAIVGNAAEHWVAVLVARKDNMDLAVGIAVGSSAQIALLVVPLLVLSSLVVGPYAMGLVFNAYELVAVVCAIAVANYVTRDGQSTRAEGAALLGLYVVLGIVFALA